MPSKIEAQIDRIRARFIDLKVALVQERDRASALNLELNKVNVVMEQLKLQNSDLTSQLNAMKNGQPTNQQVIMESNPEVSQRRKEEIDALVNEIEFCIQQLRNKHA
jgi:chromosome segregation ATPase